MLPETLRQSLSEAGPRSSYEDTVTALEHPATFSALVAPAIDRIAISVHLAHRRRRHERVAR
jgi:hypothetical protein